MASIVETCDLTHRYGSNLALDHLNLTIPEGAIFGFIGPNGAGKTTTMRILTTLLLPTSGEARVAGVSVTREPRVVRRLVGFMPDFFGVYDNMKSWEYLDFFGRSYGIPAQQRRRLIGELLDLVDLGHKRDEPVMSLSRGMKQRLSLARAMMHDPRLLILDEPASGLDPRARIELRELLRELRAMGKTIMISSHILSELAEMCTHIGIIERGKLLAAGEVQEILRTMRPHRIIEIRVVSGAARAEELLRTHPDVLELRREGARASTEAEAEPLDDETGPHTLLVDFAGDEHALGDLLALLIAGGVRISHFAEQSSDLEDIFLHVTKGIV
ncbi:MAG: ABC transporter ATP-binding protein [Roseiflexus sp.]|nr:ABC transporter ATP-binding protein [Roseiflexus sp.]MCS7287712.1 ABC transporter ATP-binding protein [Roseiflexus sp.]MDW8147911.1 ABC transporter ATP-binding protein [Roseiflexaceae bacterium]MDW8231946.1 ABC transporter ATP-binding protein [Roseiflexaceae bacterium]